MNVRGSFFLSLVLLGGILALSYFPHFDNAEREAVILRTVLSGLDRFHYNPKKIDNDFSKKVFDLYLESLDGGSRRFFTQEDIDQLAKFRTEIDDQVMEGSFEFFDLSLEILEKRIVQAAQYCEEILAEPFDFDKEETVDLDGEKNDYAANQEALKEYWRRYLKYRVMVRLSQNLEHQSNATEEEKKSFEELEASARKNEKELFDDIFKRLDKVKRMDRLSAFINAMTDTYDPHTNYYKPRDKEAFDISFSGQYEGIGARLLADGDYTKVTEVMVGGPAWKGKELDDNDVILKVAQGDEDPVDIAGMSTDDVVGLIRGKRGTEVRLTVRKVDGTIETVSIIRDVIVVEEQYAKSLMLSGVGENEKIGYISLPAFYANFNDRNNGRFCSDDIAKEIEKLKRENVKGIILDVRDNPGGSLEEVVEMTGLFIEEGPVVQVKARGREARVRSDSDESVLWDGPLVVMVNSMSASASEILAAALQDYNRAVIVGSNSTYGKGTVQTFIDLDRAIMGLEDMKPLGQVLTTIQKYYRINGGSVQLKGVQPDIVLPDGYHYMKVGERDLKFPLEWTEIASAEYSQDVYKINNLEEIKRNSNERIANHDVFQKILANAERIQEQSERSEFPLKLSEYQAYTKEISAKRKEFEALFSDKVIEDIQNIPEDIPNINAYDKTKARNEDWIKSVAKDVHLKETLHIIHDMIEAIE